MPGATLLQNDLEPKNGLQPEHVVIKPPEQDSGGDELPYEQPLYAGIFRQVRGSAQVLTPESLNELMERLFDAVDHTTNALRAQDPPSNPTACKAGCAYCCSVQVQVLAPEILHVLDYLRRTRTKSQLAELAVRVAALDDRIHGLSSPERAKLNVPCALLVDGNCSVYEARPIICRSANSTDSRRCQAAIGPNATSSSVETYVHQVAVSRQVIKALATGMRETGYVSKALELTSALRIALGYPDAFAAWQKGDPIFAAAEVEIAILPT